MQLSVDMQTVYAYALTLVRTATVVAVMPVLGGRNIPRRVKVLFAAMFAALITAWNPAGGAPVEAGFVLVLMAAREAFIGLILGGVALLIFQGVEYAGELAGMQMGFAIAGILDPQTGSQVSIVSKFQGTLALMLFLAVNGHYFVFKALLDSLTLLPVGSIGVDLAASMSYVRLAGKVFVIALQIAAPATILLLLVNVGLGVVARMVPQMNVFIVGFPLMITVGVFMFIVSMPAFVALTRSLIDGMYSDFVVVLKAL